MHTIPELASPQSCQSNLPSRRAEIAQAILEGLPRGFEFAKPFVSTEPAEGAAREVPCFYDAQHESTLKLVLGGDFTYGATAPRLATLRGLIPAEDWSLIAPVIHAAHEAGPVHVTAFLMGRFPTFEWVIEEHVELCDGLERPDFSSGDAVPQRDLSGDVCLTQFCDGSSTARPPIPGEWRRWPWPRSPGCRPVRTSGASVAVRRRSIRFSIPCSRPCC